LQELIKEDMRYRDKQLLRLKDEVLDLEDFNESVALNEFTLDDFRMELAAYIEANREKLEEAPFGLYAVVPPHAEYQTIKPGAIYCLKQRIEASGNEAVNPLQPYFLVYIRDDGEVRYNFTAPKQILEIFRAVCQGKTEPYAQLVRTVRPGNQNGQDMSRYSGLLDKAVAAIAAQFGRKNAGNLFTGRGGKLLGSKQGIMKPRTDFELITWLVIKNNAITQNSSWPSASASRHLPASRYATLRCRCSPAWVTHPTERWKPAPYKISVSSSTQTAISRTPPLCPRTGWPLNCCFSSPTKSFPVARHCSRMMPFAHP
jgi:hypothetical protein